MDIISLRAWGLGKIQRFGWICIGSTIFETHEKPHTSTGGSTEKRTRMKALPSGFC